MMNVMFPQRPDLMEPLAHTYRTVERPTCEGHTSEAVSEHFDKLVAQ